MGDQFNYFPEVVGSALDIRLVGLPNDLQLLIDWDWDKIGQEGRILL
jgi:hypothetical protein